MSRLPQPGGDVGSWGDILNDYLGQAHASDGTLKSGSVGAVHLQDGSISKAKFDASTQASLTKADGSLQASNNLSDVTASTARTNLGLGTAATMTPANLAADSAFRGAYVQLNRTSLNPLDYGAVGDGATLDDAAFAAMFAALPSVGGSIYLPAGYNFRLSQTLTLNAGLHFYGAGQRTSKITNLVSDVFTVTAARPEINLHDFGVVAGASNGSTGGHIFNFGTFGINISYLRNLYLDQRCPTKSTIVAAQWIGNLMTDCNIASENGRSVPAIKLVSTTNNLSDNTFRNIWHTDYGTPTTWVIWLEEFSGATAIGNTLEQITFENPSGGAINLRGQNGAYLRQIWLWDLATPATNHLILLDKVAGGQANNGVTLEGVARGSGALSSGLRDIASGGPGYAVGTTVRRCVAAGSQLFVIDLGYDVSQTIEDCYGTVGNGVLQRYSLAAVVGANAGSGATISTTGQFYEGQVTLTSGTSPTAGAITQINFPNGLRNAPAAVMVTPMNTAAVSAGLYVSSISTSNVIISSANALPGATAVVFGVAIHKSCLG